MKQHVTVVPIDTIILVDGEGLRFDFSAPETLHAIQWHNGTGHIEHTGGQQNTPLTEDDYLAQVAPFVALWEAEKARIEEEANRPPSPPTLEEALTIAKDAITARRQQAEYGGVIVRGTLFPTEQKDELRLYALERKFAANAAHVETWKANGVWVDMDAALFVEYAAAFQTHIPGCFAAERQKTQDLAAAGLQSAEAVTAWLDTHINTGWPGAEAGTV